MFLRVGMAAKGAKSRAKTTPGPFSREGQQRGRGAPLSSRSPNRPAVSANDDRMITAGVDLSSQTAHTASCIIEWSGLGATVTDLKVDVDDCAIAALVQSVDKLGIDVPLGWPLAFADAVAQHSRQGSWPVDYTHGDALAYRYRRTDLWVWKTLRTSPPLSVSTDRIAIPAMRAAAVFSRLAEEVALDGSGVVVEVYPAAALRRWGFTWRGYKRKEADARRLLVERVFKETAPWLSVAPSETELCLASDDAFDALVAALAARAVAASLVEPIPADERTAARKEGWIAVPREGSLERLALG